MHLQPVPQWIQGVYAITGDLYVTSDDGTADEKEPDHIYRVEISDKNNEARVVLEKTLNDIRDVGEVEGLKCESKNETTTCPCKPRQTNCVRDAKRILSRI